MRSGKKFFTKISRNTEFLCKFDTKSILVVNSIFSNFTQIFYMLIIIHQGGQQVCSTILMYTATRGRRTILVAIESCLQSKSVVQFAARPRSTMIAPSPADDLIPRYLETLKFCPGVCVHEACRVRVHSLFCV